MATAFIFSPNMFQADPFLTLTQLGAESGDFFASVSSGDRIVAPVFGGRTGANALKVAGSVGNARFVLSNGAQNEIIVHVALYKEALPAGDDRIRIRFASTANATLGYFMIDASGIGHVQNSSSVSLANSGVPIFKASEWTLFELRILMHASAGEFEIRAENGDVLMSATGLALSGTGVGQVQLFAGNGGGADFFYVDDLWVKDTTGSRNNDFGSARIFARKVVGDAPGNGWAFQHRRMLGDGILHVIVPDSAQGVRISDAAGLEIGSGDFCVEGFFRWASLPGAGISRTLMGKWREDNNTRSWRLRHLEAGGDYRLIFEASTDGAAGTVTTIHDPIFEPVLNHWYYIAVDRASGTSRIFVGAVDIGDAVRIGPAVTDSATYFNGAANATIGAQHSGTSSFLGSFGGWIDEVRWTVGASRHTAEYAIPTAKFPRDSSDPLWNSTQLLLGFDGGVTVDESQFGRVTTASLSAVAESPNDGDFGYQSIDRPLRDDTFIEAAFLPATGTVELLNSPANGKTVTVGTLTAATGVLTLTGNAGNTETVVIGGKTYTFQTVLTNSDGNVLIGATASDSIDNLIAAITLGSGSGTLYAAATTLHPTVTAAVGAGDTMGVTAKAPGTAGNAITTTATLSSGSFGGGTLSGGVDTVYTFVTSLASAYDVLIGVDADATAANLRAAINQEAGAGTIYGTGTIAHPDVFASDLAGVILRIEANIPGITGNGIALATDSSDVVLSGSALAGGADIPAPSQFFIQPIPPGVTAIRAVALATRRSLVGSGTADVQFGIRDAANNLILGTSHTPPANPAWNVDLFDSGAGGSAWSAAALIGARTYNNRTT